MKRTYEGWLQHFAGDTDTHVLTSHFTWEFPRTCPIEYEIQGDAWEADYMSYD